jgi:hypothetical protein
MTRFPFLVCMSLPSLQPSAHAAPPSPADSDNEVPSPCFSRPNALASCYGDAEVPLLHPGVPCFSSSPSPPIVRLNLPCRLAAAADALTGMVNLLLLLLLSCPSDVSLVELGRFIHNLSFLHIAHCLLTCAACTTGNLAA